MKILNELNLKKEGIDIKIIEENGIVKISINSEKANIEINGESVFEFINGDFKYLPVQLREQVKPYVEDWEGNIRSDGKDVTFDISIKGINYSCSTKSIANKKSKLTMWNWLMSYEKIAESIDINEDEEKIKLEELIKSVEALGFNFSCSHNGDEWDNSYMLRVAIGELDMDNVIKACELWSSYNKRLQKYIGE